MIVASGRASCSYARASPSMSVIRQRKPSESSALSNCPYVTSVLFMVLLPLPWRGDCFSARASSRLRANHNCYEVLQTGCLVDPVFDLQPWNFAKMPQISSHDRCILSQADACDQQVTPANFFDLFVFAQLVELGGGAAIHENDRQ